MLSLHDVITRSYPPVPWDEGDNIPWNDADFSERMLVEHLTQDHDLASRRIEKIDAQVKRLLEDLPPAPGTILDLGCGPGLYLSRLAAAGYHGVGIDFSPASIRHGRDTTTGPEYRLGDLRTADFGSGFDAVLLLYGQINVFRRAEARSILTRALTALRPGGVIVLEPQTHGHVESTGAGSPSWSAHETGLFSASPHVLLTEAFWDGTSTTATQRFYVVDAGTGAVTRHAISTVAYKEGELVSLLEEVGFENIATRPSLAGEESEDSLFAILAESPAG